MGTCCQAFLPRDAMQARSMLSCGVCLFFRLSVCPSVCHVRGSCQNEQTYLGVFLPSGNHKFLVRQNVLQYLSNFTKQHRAVCQRQLSFLLYGAIELGNVHSKFELTSSVRVGQREAPAAGFRSHGHARWLKKIALNFWGEVSYQYPIATIGLRRTVQFTECGTCQCPLTVKQILVECVDLKDVRNKHFVASSMKKIYLIILKHIKSLIISKKLVFINNFNVFILMFVICYPHYSHRVCGGRRCSGSSVHLDPVCWRRISCNETTAAIRVQPLVGGGSLVGPTGQRLRVD